MQIPLCLLKAKLNKLNPFLMGFRLGKYGGRYKIRHPDDSNILATWLLWWIGALSIERTLHGAGKGFIEGTFCNNYKSVLWFTEKHIMKQKKLTRMCSRKNSKSNQVMVSSWIICPTRPEVEIAGIMLYFWDPSLWWIHCVCSPTEAQPCCLATESRLTPDSSNQSQGWIY